MCSCVRVNSPVLGYYVQTVLYHHMKEGRGRATKYPCTTIGRGEHQAVNYLLELCVSDSAGWSVAL